MCESCKSLAGNGHKLKSPSEEARRRRRQGGQRDDEDKRRRDRLLSVMDAAITKSAQGSSKKKVRKVAPPVGEGSKKVCGQTWVSGRVDTHSVFLLNIFSFCTCYLEIYV